MGDGRARGARSRAAAYLALLLAGLGAGVPDAAADTTLTAASDAGSPAAEAAAPPLFMETYTEGVYSRHEEDNASGFTDVKIGKRFDLGRPVDIYLKARMHRDQRDFFWNNHLDAGAGVRVSLLDRAALSVYAEMLGGFYYRTGAEAGDLRGLERRIERNRAALDAVQERFGTTTIEIFRRNVLEDTVFTRKQLDSLDRTLTAHGTSLGALDAYLDSLELVKDSLDQAADALAGIPAGPLTEFRAGFMFWYGKAPDVSTPGPRRRLGRLWCDLYADGTFTSLSRTVQSRDAAGVFRDSTARFANFILYANPDLGLALFDGPAGALIAYATLYAWLDTHGDWWNNRAMGGPGLRHKPFRDFDLVLTMEYLWGAYYGRERREDPNPYDPAFQDVRLSASFWYGLGF